VPPSSLDRLDGILRHVSRSFYLSLKILPRSLRRPIGLAYLLARAADTIADTAVISPGERLRYLEQFRSLFQTYDTTVLSAIGAALTGPQQIPAERALLASLDQCFALYHTCHQADQARIGQLLLTLTQGMLLDLTIFPHEHDGRVVALKTRDELDRYTYYVAGCVGEFWTEMYVAHRPSLAGWNVEAMKQWGVRFGKGLQLTNILRDLARDLRIGRCYIPLEDLAPCGLEPTDLLNPACIARVRPVLHKLLARTLDHYRAGWAYTLAIPRREVRMRLACAWPLFIGLRTLDLIASADNLLEPTITVKIARRTVYRMLLGSGMLIFSNRALNRYAQHLRRPLCLSGSRGNSAP
jgi:farnesyl-diphosphate farnesyltransferase